MSSNASHLFEKIGDGAAAQAAIEKMIAEKHLENEHLDYKGASRIPDTDIKKHWGKALSAFANTGGGVLVWGVDCRKVKQPASEYEIDEPTGRSLHPNAVALAQQLSELLRSATEDTVEGVIIRPVPFDGGTAGCVVCLIPEGSNKPYRAMFFDQKYMMRLPDRMEIIPHSLLRSLFYPKLSANPEVQIIGKPLTQRTGPEYAFLFLISIINTGKATARDTFATVVFSHPVQEVEFHGMAWQAAHEIVHTGGSYTNFQYISVRPIHPTFEQKLSVFSWQGNEFDLLASSPFSLIFEIFTNDGEARPFTVSFSAQELAEETKKKAVEMK